MSLIINPKFKNLIPPLSSEEYKGLEDSLLLEGCRDAIVTWEGQIIDGHNRYEICLKHNIPYETIPYQMETEDEVIIWIIDNQLSRRNLNKFQRIELMSEKKKVLLRIGKLTQGTRTDLLSNNDKKLPGHDTRQMLADELDISTGQYAQAEIIIKKASPEIKEKVRNDEISIGQAYQRTRQEEIKEKLKDKTPPIPTDKYRVIYADCPWKYGNSMPDYFTEQADHYPLMSIQELCLLPIKDICEDNAVLFFWVTSPILEESFKVISSWGFKYKSSFVWDKVKHNMGHYNSVRHEFLLVCIKGSCQPDIKKLFDSVVSIERTEHSVKPEYFREIIDTLYPNGKRIELFSRIKIEGWDSYGNETK